MNTFNICDFNYKIIHYQPEVISLFQFRRITYFRNIFHSGLLQRFIPGFAQCPKPTYKFGFLISQLHIRIWSPERRGFALLTNSFVPGSQVSAYPILRVSGRPMPMHIWVYYSAKNKAARREKQAVCSYTNERWSYRTAWLATELIRPRAGDLNNSPCTKVVFVMWLFCFERHGRKISIWILVRWWSCFRFVCILRFRRGQLLCWMWRVRRWLIFRYLIKFANTSLVSFRDLHIPRRVLCCCLYFEYEIFFYNSEIKCFIAQLIKPSLLKNALYKQ